MSESEHPSDQSQAAGQPKPSAGQLMESIRQASNALAGKISRQENALRILQEKVRRQTGQDDSPVQGQPESGEDYQSDP
ncbi:MAG: hypothetical protein ACLFUJ_02310 [Phycisphaerae bacterium]